MAAAAAKNPRLEALLELERRGQLPPQYKAELQAARQQGTAKPTASGDMLETSKARDDARKAMVILDRLQPQLNRVRDLYGKNFKGSDVSEYLPAAINPRNAQLDAAISPLASTIRGATRTAGEGAMSDFESRLALQQAPNRWSNDAANEETFRNLQQFIDSNRATYSKQLGLPSAPPRKQAQQQNIRLDADGNIIQ